MNRWDLVHCLDVYLEYANDLIAQEGATILPEGYVVFVPPHVYARIKDLMGALMIPAFMGPVIWTVIGDVLIMPRPPEPSPHLGVISHCSGAI